MSNYERRQRQLNSFLRTLPREMFEKFKSTTPVRTGNAQSKTVLRNSEIVANYPYAQYLEDADRPFGSRRGRSKQAPSGMAEPTIDHVRQMLRRL